MDAFIFWNKILVFLIDAVGICLGVWVFLSNPKGKLNRLFAWLIVFMMFWVNFAFFARELGGRNNFLSLLYVKIAWTVTPLFFTFLYLLAIGILKKEAQYKILTKLAVVLGSTASLLVAFSYLVVHDIVFRGLLLRIIYGSGMLPFLAIILFLVVATLYPLVKEYLKVTIEKKKKLEYFLLGILIFYFANVIFNIILPVVFDITRLYFIGDYSTIVLLGLTAFAIVRQELFGIRVVFTTLFVGLIAVLLSLDAIVFTSELGFQIIKVSILTLFLVFGYSLIKSVLNEIRLREKLQEAYQKLEKLDKTKSEFISIASHQLRTPLTAVKGYISMVLEGTYGKLNQKQRKPIENVFQSNERLIRLVNDLLNLSRLEAGKIKYEPQLTDLADLVSGVINELKINAERKGLYVKMEKERLAPFLADPDKLRQVILNIIDNAIKYTKEGGILVRLKKTGSLARIEIADTGAGMEKEEIKNLFQMFARSTAGAQLHTEGAGIGLYVAKQFIEMHKGRIWAESKGKNQGSVFYLELPIV